MALSLQEQLLQAGVANKKAAKKARADKRKKQKAKQSLPGEAALAVQQVIDNKKTKDRELNNRQNALKQERSIAAQVKQLISLNRQVRKGGDLVLNFTDNGKIKRMYVTDALHKAVLKGKLAVVASGEEYELVAIQVADKIAQRSEHTVVYVAPTEDLEQADDDGQDDWYADFDIPDDLTW
jgi:hypothetical protein